MVVNQNHTIYRVRRFVALLSIGLFLFVFQSCEEDYYWGEVDCEYCYQVKPEFGDLQVDITINAENRAVPLVIYKGEFDEGIIEYIDTATSESYSLDVPINEFYSVAAEYFVDGKRIIAIDGDRIKTGKVVGSCDKTCWIIEGGFIDVRLKYDE